MSQPSPGFDRQVRQHIYEFTLSRGYPPTLADAAASLAVSASEVSAAFRRLADAHMLVLQPETDEILMASPFSAVPTPFLVETDAFTCFGNCIWDALGIPAMLKQDARIKTACPDCGTGLSLSVSAGSLRAPDGLIHFALPARRWWDNIVFT